MKSKYRTRKCPACSGKGYTKKSPCNKCLYHKYIVLIDFHKIQSPQVQCQSCRQYCTKNYIVNWSTQCDHQYCVKCVIMCIRDQLNGANKIPKCVNRKTGCDNELTMNKMKFIAKLVDCDDTAEWYCKRFEEKSMSHLCHKFNVLIKGKNIDCGKDKVRTKK